ncbi:polyprenyl diphosphate synthase [Pseudothauera nasutitermitis]|uniref:polyprenyl diphosphate synthase n=1 Tax=Pseudothauera nasutitermitis TaxID=2565930 RepID=UPI001454D05F|nr:polyprenyl diphosphate synthase [Pseudothauera nasutitermitis]
MAGSSFTSSTRVIPEVSAVPRHIAIIMDGNGRWARKRLMPRVAGHTRGVEAVRGLIRACVQRGVGHLTLFAFSSENWRRPADEVSFLMQLFMRSLQKEVKRLHENGIRFRVIGDLSRFEPGLVELVRNAEALTAGNDRLTLTVAANYGGRWDILQAVNRLVRKHPQRQDEFTEEELAAELSMNFAPEPDLFIRTGGEQRVSNFLLWQLAYAELYFTDTLWPDFDDAALDAAIASYRARERRFGRTSEQLRESGQGGDGHA